MLNRKLLFFLLIILLLSSLCFSQLGKNKIAFLYLENVSGSGEKLDTLIYDRFCETLSTMPSLQLIKKEDWLKTLQEKQIKEIMEIATLLDVENIAKLGKIIGVDKILFGEINVYGEEIKKKSANVYIQINLRLIDVEKKSVEKEFLIEGKSTLSGKKMGEKAKTEAYNQLNTALIEKIEGKEGKEVIGEFIGNKKSFLFHLPTALHLPHKQDSIKFVTFKEAKEAGFKPCPICFPEFSVSTEKADDLELVLGQEISGVIEHYYRILRDDEKTSYVERIGQSIVNVTPRRNLRYIFTILNTDEINAFACGGGYVYVTKGLLDIIESDDELASVLAHEIAHTVKKHAVRQYKRDTNLAFLGAVVSVATGAPNLVSDFAQLLIMNGYDRKYEREADDLSLIYCLKSHYDPNGYITVLNKLKEMEKSQPSKIEIYFRSHPSTSDRIKKGEEWLSNYKGLLNKLDEIYSEKISRRVIEEKLQ